MNVLRSYQDSGALAADPAPGPEPAAEAQAEGGSLNPGSGEGSSHTKASALVRLERLSGHHADELAAAASHDRSAFAFTWVPHGKAEAREYVRTQLGRAQNGELVPFAQMHTADGRAVGSTSYFNFRSLPGSAAPFAVEIGFTWLAAPAQRSGINIEAKLLLLTHAFERVGVARVDFKTDARNERSRRAIEGLGARRHTNLGVVHECHREMIYPARHADSTEYAGLPDHGHQPGRGGPGHMVRHAGRWR